MKINNFISGIILSVFLLATSSTTSFAQSKFNADKVEFDEANGDGAFRARNKDTKKWGMYQGSASGEPDEMIPMEYDKVDFFEVNASFTGVYKNGKVGIYLCKWSYEDKHKQTVPCQYEDYRRVDTKAVNHDVFKMENTTEYLAMKKNGKWGWVDWLTGEEKSEFKYDSVEDLPQPTWQQHWILK